MMTRKHFAISASVLDPWLVLGPSFEGYLAKDSFWRMSLNLFVEAASSGTSSPHNPKQRAIKRL